MGGIVGRFRTGLAVGESRPKHDWPRTRAAPTALPAGPQPVSGSDILDGKPGLCWQVAHDREVIAPNLGSTVRAKRGKWQHKPFAGGDDSYQGCGDACGITPWTCSHAAQALRKAQGATRIGLWHKRSMHGLMTLACWSGCFWPKTRPALATRLKHCRWPCQAATSFLPTRLVPAAPLAQLLSARRQAFCQYRTQAPLPQRLCLAQLRLLPETICSSLSLRKAKRQRLGHQIRHTKPQRACRHHLLLHSPSDRRSWDNGLGARRWISISRV
jgi:hypothetical protein